MPRNLPLGRLSFRLLPMLLVAYACLLPRELSIVIEDASLPPYRLALLVFVPFAIANLARQPVRPSFIDMMALFASVWFMVALYMTTSLAAGLVSGGSNGLDFGFAYLLGRSSIRTPQDMRMLFTFFIPGLLAVFALMAVESIGHKMILRPMLADLLNVPDPYIYVRTRFGLLRATGPFPHPILGGVFLASVLPLAWYATHNLKHRTLALAAAFGAIFTVSATAVLGLAIGLALIFGEVVQRITRLPIFLIIGFYLSLFITAISVGSEGGLMSFLIRRLSLDPGSGYYRLWIWDYGGAEALANPLFGIGQRDWARPEGMISNSVDAYWLALTMFYGFPAAIAAFLVMGGAIFGLLRTQKWRLGHDKGVGSAMIFCVFIVMFSGLTVHLWEGILAWILLICGASVSLATQARLVPSPLPTQSVPQGYTPFSWHRRQPTSPQA